MIYDNSSVRRQDRLLDKTRATELLMQAEWGVMSVCDNGQPYAVPVNFVWNAENAIYIHCAPEGRKIEAIKGNGRVSFCIVGHTNVLSDKFTTEYESLIIQGNASVVLSDKERTQALEMLLDKYSPQDKATGLKYTEKSFHRTAVIRMDILRISGKCKKIK